MDHISLKNFDLTANPKRVFLLGGTLLLRVAASNMNGASILNSKEGFMRKRVLLFNDLILVCKAHGPTLDANGNEEYDDTSIDGVNELELVLNLNEMMLNLMITNATSYGRGESTAADAPSLFDKRLVKLAERADGEYVVPGAHQNPNSRDKRVATRGTNAKSLMFEMIHYRARTKHEMKLHLLAPNMELRDMWVGELESIMLLNRMGTELSNRPGWYYTLVKDGFYAAAYNGDLKTLKHLLLEEFMSVSEVNRQDEAGMTALMWAAMNGHAMTCRLLLENGADPEIRQTQGGNTALHLAAGKGHVDIVRSLLAFGAHTEHRNHTRSSALGLALLFAGGKEDIDCERSVAMKKVVNLLYSQGAQLGEKDHEGSSLLDLCVARQLLPSVTILVQLGVPVNDRHPSTGLTPLQAVCSKGHCGRVGYEILCLLVGRGAHINHRADITGLQLTTKALSEAVLNQLQMTPSSTHDKCAKMTPLSILCKRYEAAIRRERSEGVIEGLASGGSSGSISSRGGGKENVAPASSGTKHSGMIDPLLAIRQEVDKEREALRAKSRKGGSSSSSSSRPALAVITPDSTNYNNARSTPSSSRQSSSRRGSFKGGSNSTATTPIYSGAGYGHAPYSASTVGSAAVLSPADSFYSDDRVSVRSAASGSISGSISGSVIEGNAGSGAICSSADIFKCILELTRMGARWSDEHALIITRPSMKAAIKDSRQRWGYMREPPTFLEFVDRKQRNGEILFALKSCWQADASASACRLCSEGFSSFSLRKHHCRACGMLVCDKCSSKRLQLAVMPPEDDQHGIPLSQKELAAEYSRGRRETFMSTPSGRGTMGSMRGGGNTVSPGQSKKERCCDSCFVGLVTSSLEDSCSTGGGSKSDRYAIRQMREAATDLIGELKGLVRALNGQMILADTKKQQKKASKNSKKRSGRNNNNNNNNNNHIEDGGRRTLADGEYSSDDDNGEHSEDDRYDSEDDEDEIASTSTGRTRDSLDDRDPTRLSNFPPEEEEEGDRRYRSTNGGQSFSASERLSSAVMTLAGCSTAGVGADGTYRSPALKLSLVHDDPDFRRSVKQNARLIAQVTKLLEVEKVAHVFMDSAKVFQKDIGVTVDHE
jgi:ankyrin repeat protein